MSLKLYNRFSTLRIVCNHLNAAVTIEAVQKCGPTVTGTITAHHLFLIVYHTFDPFCFRKPVVNTKADCDAFSRGSISGNLKSFFGSDSGPYSVDASAEKIRSPRGC